MKKLFLIGIKDLKLIFRDRAALTFMLLAPFLLTIGMGFVTGRFSGNSSGGRKKVRLRSKNFSVRWNYQEPPPSFHFEDSRIANNSSINATRY